MHLILSITFIISFITIIQSSNTRLNPVGKCLSDLATHELSNSYNYLQISSKLGTTNAYPGFSSLFIKLSDNDASKAHDIVKLLVLRKIKLDRLVNVKGVTIRDEVSNISDVSHGLKEARVQNEKTWKIVERCHQEANNISDGHIQDYLESHLLDHHIEIDKLLEDFQHRLDDFLASEKELQTFMLDEELLNTYGDRRKDIFS